MHLSLEDDDDDEGEEEELFFDYKLHQLNGF